MPRVRVHNIAISVDGYAAGPDQSMDNPIGIGGIHLHDWMFKTRSWSRMQGEEGGEDGLDNDFISRGDENVGATIMGRNMFSPYRGAWADDEWRGWWGDNPPYHHPTFVLTHYPRPSVPMEGGTTFHFIDGGIEVALAHALEAAGGMDIRIAGGASTIRQYLRAGLVDEMDIAISPILLGRGERLFDNLDSALDRYQVVEQVSSPAVTHVLIGRRAG
jgi:dihydrofolate reductase